MSSAKIYLGQNVDTLTTTPRFDNYVGVSLKTDSNSTPFTAGDVTGDTGRVLEVTCDYASQAMANNILTQIKGYSYQPFSADGASLEPAAEIGDGITVGGVYSGLFSQDISFGRLMQSDVKAPTDEELAHEFGYIGEDGKYATYASLKNGTASINGAGLINSTVANVKISDLDGGKLYSSSVGEGKTTFASTHAANIATNAANISTLSANYSVIANGNFSQISTSRIVFGNYSLYVASDGDVRGQYVG